MKHNGYATGNHGMVSSAHTLISQSGLDVLKQGGNAMDACVAMANTSSVVLPDMAGLGGDVFLLYYEASSRQVYALNGAGAAPYKASKDHFLNKGYTRAPGTGIDSVALMGEARAIRMGLERFGSMSFGELCTDAIRLAEEGCPITSKVARHLHTDYDKVKNNEILSSMFLHEDGTAKQTGELYTNKPLADTLRYIAEHGLETCYEGKIADSIIRLSNEKGGLITHEDLEDVSIKWEAPISFDYHGHVIFQSPPVSQGIIHLEEMNILSSLNIKDMDEAELIHTMCEAKKLAFNDRLRWFGDPDHTDNPIEQCLDPEYGKILAGMIDPNRSFDSDDLYGHIDGHTTSFVCVDQWGNGCSFIHSIANVFGSGEVTDTGIILNDRMSGFSFVEGHPNEIEGGKRTMHTLNTYLICDHEGNLRYVGNTPGGDRQPQWNMQNLVMILDKGMDVQSALNVPKWHDAQTDKGNILSIEETVGEEVLQTLRNKGHQLKVVGELMGSGASQIIEISEDGELRGGWDPRGDGCAIGY